MIHWILIAYLSVGNGGGPIVAEFSSKLACEAAIVTIRREMSARFGGVCIPSDVVQDGSR